MDRTVNVKENIKDALKPVFGEVPVPKGAIEAQVKRMWINQFGDVPPDLLQETSNTAQYEFERFPTRKQYHDLLIRISSMKPLQEKPKTEYDLWLEEVNARQRETDRWFTKFEPELHETIIDKAVDYYMANNLCTAPEQKRMNGNVETVMPPVDANAKLRKILSIPEDERNAYQAMAARLLRSTVIEHLQQTGHLTKFEKTIGL